MCSLLDSTQTRLNVIEKIVTGEWLPSWYQLSGTVLTKYHRRDVLHNRNLLCLTTGDLMFQIHVSRKLVQGAGWWCTPFIMPKDLGSSHQLAPPAGEEFHNG